MFGIEGSTNVYPSSVFVLIKSHTVCVKVGENAKPIPRSALQNSVTYVSGIIITDRRLLPPSGTRLADLEMLRKKGETVT